MLRAEEILPVYDMNISGLKTAPPYLIKDDSQLNLYDPPKHPHSLSPGRSSHPHVVPARRLIYGNDNSSLVRQTRGHYNRPDPVPGINIRIAHIIRMLKTYINTHTHRHTHTNKHKQINKHTHIHTQTHTLILRMC